MFYWIYANLGYSHWRTDMRSSNGYCAGIQYMVDHHVLRIFNLCSFMVICDIMV